MGLLKKLRNSVLAPINLERRPLPFYDSIVLPMTNYGLSPSEVPERSKEDIKRVVRAILEYNPRVVNLIIQEGYEVTPRETGTGLVAQVDGRKQGRIPLMVYSHGTNRKFKGYTDEGVFGALDAKRRAHIEAQQIAEVLKERGLTGVYIGFEDVEKAKKIIEDLTRKVDYFMRNIFEEDSNQPTNGNPIDEQLDILIERQKNHFNQQWGLHL
jgi:hypothetical protein